MKRLFPALFVLATLAIAQGCKKSPPVITNIPPPRTDTVSKPDTTTPPVETILYVSRIEEDYEQSNPHIVRRSRDFSFFYDGSKRLVQVGIRNYGGILFDTATCRLTYDGDNKKPSMVIAPNRVVSGYGGTLYYDTTWFAYNSSGRIVYDSSVQHAPGQFPAIETRPLTRSYSYPDNMRTFISWRGIARTGGEVEALRSDTINASGGRIGTLKSTFAYPTSLGLTGNYAKMEAVTYTSYINPLSKLNISGTIYALIYTPVTEEVVGNSVHKAVYNSNILPYYLDFYSPAIPSQFYLGGFTSSDFLIAAMYDAFDIQITAGTVKPEYPSRISVGATTALDDRVVYRYYY